MQAKRIIVAVAAMLLAAGAAEATITIDTVAVGDTGNAADTTGFGSVSYAYNIGKYEVTAGQYTAFLNSVGGVDTYGLYHPNMADTSLGSGITQSGGGVVGNPSTYSVAAAFTNRPVNYVNFWTACRFANWLSNGQPTGAQGAGTTETGAYTINGYNGPAGASIQRNAGATWSLPNENEWYKAAYYKGGSTNAGYWLYPIRSNTAPGRDMADPFGNNANYRDPSDEPIDNGMYTTVAGEFQNSASPYGTFDQGGNVWEWTDAIPYQDPDYAYRGMRGGSLANYVPLLIASPSYYDDPRYADFSRGFRVAEAVPEPLTMVAVLMGLAGLGRYVRRRAQQPFAKQ